MIKVFKVKDLIGYLAKIIIVLVAVALVIKVLEIGKKDGETETATDSSSAWLFCIDDMLPQIGINKKVEETKETSGIKFAFSSELEVMESIENNEIVEENTANVEEENNNASEENGQSETAQNGEALQSIGINKDWTVTEVDNSGVNPRYTDEYNGVFINNGTNYQLTQEMLTPDVEVNKNKVVIYHTHTCESYTPTDKFNYTMTGNYRTTDLNYSVSRVGDELAKYLENYGYNVNHDKSVNDYPAYTGSYNRSLEAVKRDLKENSSTQIIFDLHRDAVGSSNEYAPTVKIGDEYVAQIMFVIGTDGGGLNHPNWQQNLKFAIKVQQKANELYPGLFRPIIVRDSRYNQHVSKAASIIEVGATGNTLEQCLGSMKYFSKVLNEVLKE